MNMRYKLRCLGYAEVGDDIWFASLYFNGLMKLNTVSGKLEAIHKFPHYDIDQGWLYSTVRYLNGYLICVPNNSGEIVSYHLKSGRFVSISLDERRIGAKKTYFVSACVYQNYVYMFPTGALCIVRYDVTDHTVKYLENPVSDLLAALPDTSYGFYQQFEMIDKKIYLPFLDVNAIAVFDLEDESVHIRYLNIEGGCSTINYVNGNFYLASWKRPEIYCWNEKTEEIKTYQSFPKDFSGERTFFHACYADGALLFFPEISNMVVSFSMETGRIREEKRIENSDREPLMTFLIQQSEKGYCTLITDSEFVNSIAYADSRLNLIPQWRVDYTHNKAVVDRYFFRYGGYRSYSETIDTFEEYMEIVSVVNESGGINRKKRYGEIIFKEVKDCNGSHRSSTGEKKHA